MKLRSLLNEQDDAVKFVFSHSFINSKGIPVSQYKLTGGNGGYARVEEHKTGFEMTNVIIDDELRNRGIATNFYIEMNKKSYDKTGKPLRSIAPDENGNIELSADGKRLWDSLVKKGLAKRIKPNVYRFK